MPELPPRAEVLDALRLAVLPAAAAAAAVFAPLARLAPRRAGPTAAALALLAALLAGNHFSHPFPDLPAGWNKSWHWVWPAAGLAVLVEAVARLPGVGAGPLLRGAAAGVLAAAVAPVAWPAEVRWALPLLAFAAAGVWAVVDAVGRRAPGGSTAAAMSVVAWGAAVVLMHHKWLGGADVGVFASAGLGVVAVLAWVVRADAGAAGAAAVPVLVGVLAVGRSLVDSPIPPGAFLAVGLAPLGLGVFLVPRVGRLAGTRAGVLVKLAVVLVPVGWAVVTAMAASPLSFGEGTGEWE